VKSLRATPIDETFVNNNKNNDLASHCSIIRDLCIIDLALSRKGSGKPA
jgi:hypothetical protein